MSIKKILIPPTKKAIVTNNGSTDIKLWKGSPTDLYCILQAGDSDQIFNDSDSKDIEIYVENYEYSSVEIVDYDEC